MNQKTLNNISYGLFVLTASLDGKDNGCIINTAAQIASDPLTLSIAVNKQNHTHDMILKSKKFNISIISEAADFSLFTHFGFQSGRNVDKFAGFTDFKRGENGIPIITKGTNAYVSAAVKDTLDLGSHTLFLASITDMEVLNDIPSATYSYYHSCIKPQKQAPAKGKTVWVCDICGYIYEGDELPADFVCPICKHPASDFSKQTR